MPRFLAALSTVLSSLPSLWGFFCSLVLASVVFIAVAFLPLSGAAVTPRSCSSSLPRACLWHKAGCIFAVLAAGILDAVVGYLLGNIEGLALPFTYTVIICPLVVTWYLLMELGSILENVGKMGAPLPEFLKKMIAVLKATVDTAGENTESGKGK